MAAQSFIRGIGLSNEAKKQAHMGIGILGVRFPRFDVEIPEREYTPSLDKNLIQFDKAKKIIEITMKK
jgi:hypothetical protein